MEDPVPRSFALLVIAAISATVNLLFAGRMPSSLESFREIFKSFGVDPGAGANFVMDAPYAWWTLALASLILLAWIARKSQVSIAEHRRMKLSLAALIITTTLAYGFVAVSIYVPIFKLGAGSP